MKFLRRIAAFFSDLLDELAQYDEYAAHDAGNEVY
jgi:hypothetical protein